MSIEFLILLGVLIVILDQIRRIRAGHQQEIAALQAQLAEKQAQIDQLTNPDVQAELDAFEAEVTPAPAPAPAPEA